jgi:transcriptional regulator with XRE-family HTH domain
VLKGIMLNINKIEKRRVQLKISKREMAKRLDMSRQSYYDTLSKKSTTFKTLDKIASILGLKAKDLIL